MQNLRACLKNDFREMYPKGDAMLHSLRGADMDSNDTEKSALCAKLLILKILNDIMTKIRTK